MTTKTGEKLRGRKRPKDVLAKAWATRRKNKAAKLRAAKEKTKTEQTIRARSAPASTIPATKPRGSTMLIRKGRRNGLTTAAKKLAARAGSAKKTRHSDRPGVMDDEHIINVHGATAASVGAAKHEQELAAHNDRVGISARAIMVEARKRAHPEATEAAIARMLVEIEARTRGEVIREMDRDETARIREYARQTNRKIICSFIASLDQHAASANGLPPSMVISSYTLCRMVDVLNEVGYKADGYRAPNHN